MRLLIGLHDWRHDWRHDWLHDSLCSREKKLVRHLGRVSHTKRGLIRLRDANCDLSYLMLLDVPLCHLHFSGFHLDALLL